MLIFAILCLIVGVVAAFAYSKAKANPSSKLGAAKKLRALQEARKTQEKEQALPIESVQPGGVIQLQDVGLRSETIDAQVTARHVHRSGPQRWIELEAESASGKVYIAVQNQDELQVSVSLQELSLQDLGVEHAQLEGRGPEELDYDGTRYQFDEHGRAQFCRNGNELEAEPYQYWEYAADGDDFQTLTLVRWPDGSVEGFYGVNVDPSGVTVFSES